MLRLFEVITTYDCNASCIWCQRLCGQAAPPANSRLEPSQIAALCERLIENHGGVKFLKLSGGEPTLSPEYLAEIIFAIKPYFGDDKIKYIRIHTNGTRRRRRFGARVKYMISPPSGKKALHTPFLLSPKDNRLRGYKGWRRLCQLQVNCGPTFEPWGFTACPVYAVLGRLLNVNPYGDDVMLRGSKAICQHCVYSLPKGKRLELQQDAIDGKIPYPSQRFVEGMKDFAREYDRWQV